MKIKISENLRKMAMGLLVAVMAISASAFTKSKKVVNEKNLQTRYWINSGSDYNIYCKGVPKVYTNCYWEHPAQCAIQSEDGSIPDTFPIEDVGLYDVQSVPGSQPAVYDDEYPPCP